MNRIGNALKYLAAATILASMTALLVAMAYSGSIKNSYHWTKSSKQAAPAAITEDGIRSLLAKVIDSELGVNIVELGLIYEIGLPGPGAVEVTMTFTTPYCPFSKTIIAEIERTLMGDQAITDARLRVVFEPAWSWSRVDQSVRDRIIRQFSSPGHNHG
ncbi:MAG: metal-sulfur cluster assembly factor [Syntrophobacteraceae bacterium]